MLTRKEELMLEISELQRKQKFAEADLLKDELEAIKKEERQDSTPPSPHVLASEARTVLSKSDDLNTNDHDTTSESSTTSDTNNKKSKKKKNNIDEESTKSPGNWTLGKMTSCVWFKFYAEQLGLDPTTPVDLQIVALRLFLSSLTAQSSYNYASAIASTHSPDTSTLTTAMELTDISQTDKAIAICALNEQENSKEERKVSDNSSISLIPNLTAPAPSYPLPFSFHAVVHYKDTNRPKTDAEKWRPSLEKPHCHLLIFYSDRDQNNRYLKTRMSTLLNLLSKYGLVFREGQDDSILFRDTRFPQMRTKDLTRIIAYHTHETYDARETDGKELYDRSECFTNIPDNALQTYYDYYFTHLDAPSDKELRVHAPSTDAQDEIMRQFYQHGLECHDFDDEWQKLAPAARRVNGLKRACLDSYEYGLDKLMDSDDSLNHTRCSIYIYGDAGKGKSYNAEAALRSIGCSPLIVDGGGTGKLDNLKATHDAILVNDEALPNILGIADDRYVRTYRRNSGNPLFTGDYFVVTHNLPFQQYIDKIYSKSLSGQEQKRAALSRFIVCRITDDGLALEIAPTRGNAYRLQKKAELFKRFYDAFQQSFKSFEPLGSISPSDIFMTVCPGAYKPEKYNAEITFSGCIDDAAKS